MNKAEWIKSKVGTALDGLSVLGIEFYYMAMHDNGMDLSDADRYAWLNMLFGEDIGIKAAREIINWYWEHDLDVMDITTGDRKEVEKVCDELGLYLFFYDWLIEEPGYIEYDYMAYDVVKRRIEELGGKYNTPQLVGFIYGLWQDYMINDRTEEMLYELVDPESKYNNTSEYWADWEGKNPLDYYDNH